MWIFRIHCDPQSLAIPLQKYSMKHFQVHWMIDLHIDRLYFLFEQSGIPLETSSKTPLSGLDFYVVCMKNERSDLISYSNLSNLKSHFFNRSSHSYSTILNSL